MEQLSDSNQRIANNTLLLYFRMLLIMVVSLYTSRVVLSTLGVSDFGIYNVVGGVVSMLGMIRSVLAAGTSRYLNYSLGKGDKELACKTFNVSIIIYIILCIVIIVLAETIGVWFLNTQLVIPECRIVAANYVFQFSILSSVNQMLVMPYNSVIISYERMGVYAYISVLEVFLKLVISYLICVSPIDKLIFYSLLMLASDLLICGLYRLYCHKNFEICKFRVYRDYSFYKEMLSYSGWNFFGALAGFARSQGLNVLISMFFNPSVCASRGIAYQVNNAITQFSSNFFLAAKPQIIKYYARGEINNMEMLVFRTSRLSFFLLLILSLPIIIEVPFIIQLWLGQSPEYVEIFVRLIIIFSTIEAMAHPLMTVCHATGRIMVYQVVVGILQVLIIPISYIFLKNGFTPPIVFVVAIVIGIVCLFVRLWICKWLVGFPFWRYTYQVLLNAVFLSGISSIVPLILYFTLENSTMNAMIVCLSSIMSSLCCVYFYGLESNERSFLLKMISLRLKKNGKKNTV